MKFVDLNSQFAAYESEIRREMEEVLQSAQFIMGPKGSELEGRLAAYAGVTHAIGCSSGTDALLLALMAQEVRAGDEIVTTPFTFVATAEAIALTGARPVFVDIDPATYNIDAGGIEEAITKNTRGIIAVSLYGQCADMETILSVAGGYGLFVIEDGAQSFGAERNGRRSCGWPHAGTTSFFPSKPLGCYGDGGMVFTSDDGMAERIRGLRNHGQWERYLHRVIGINGRLDDLQAAVLLGKLPRFSDELSVRAYMGARYSDRLGDVVGVPAVTPGNTHIFAQYTIRTPQRDDLVAHLRENGIPTAVHYPIPLHLQEAFRGLGYEKGRFPQSEAAAQEVVSLPMSAFLSEADQDEVIRQVRRFFGK
ncbi:MAG TPA: DegT/DnrJ/EryC1/StrS family aminotransferase [Candidatus Deferrimicrobiaceae bacterium]|nr:DegT/DnrJ/EryC1/StrS family aminotransferase [Candidatus Deferrimicrobiaceae bacterium]